MSSPGGIYVFGGVLVEVHLVLEKVVIVVEVMMEQGQGRLAGIVRSSSWLLLPSPPSPPLAHCVCCAALLHQPGVNIVHTHRASPLQHDALPPPPALPCPGGTIWVKATRCSSHQSTDPSPKPSLAMHQCTNAPTAPAPMALLPPTLKKETPMTQSDTGRT